jgi:hypothetical protein
MSIATHTLTLSPTQIYGAYAAPIIVLPAPPVGYVNNILIIKCKMTWVANNYVTATTLLFGDIGCATNAYTLAFYDPNILPSTVNFNKQILRSSASPFVTADALYVTTNATATTGDSPITVIIAYEQTILS